MEYLGAVTSLMQCLCGQENMKASVAKQCSYLDKPQAILERLDLQMNILCAQETDIRHKIIMGTVSQDMQPKAEVKLWLQNVDKIKDAVNQMKEQYAQDKRCLISCFPNCSYRLKLGNVVDRKLHEVNILLEHAGKISESLLVRNLQERGKPLPATRLMGETAKRNLKRIWDCLMDEDVGRVGIYGMGGVGKTTIMKEINNRLVRDNADFEKIIWVTASRECNFGKLQKDIAKAVGLDLNIQDDEIIRAAVLHEALMRQKRFLLIIDDLWEAFSLENLGIPNTEQGHISKFVVTTRSLGVCRGMETMEEVEIQPLPAEEAWDLFKQKVGEDVLSLPRTEAIAKQVARECGGLPLAIVAVGRALRKERNARQWEVALRELQNSTASLEGMENQVFARLRFSYERLRDDIARSCFLYCALYPEDHHIEIEELIRYWIYEGLLGKLGDIESKMLQGYIIVDDLKNACMLESVDQGVTGGTDEHVKMHDLIRDMAIVLTRAHPQFLVRAGHGIRTAPVEDEWSSDLERVSLMRNDLSCLTCEPKCPNLSTLLLQYNSISKGINPSFFNHMRNLRVLDLSYTGIDRLPDSLSNLWNLRALLLRSCWNLHYIPTLENLKELRVLDLAYTSIERMPHGLEMLVNLRHLDLSYCHAYEYPIYLLPKYKLLENLLLVSQWQSFDCNFVDLVASCMNLSLLEVNFSTLADFEYYFTSGHWYQLKSFKVCIGFPPSSMRIGRNSVALFGVQMGPVLLPRGVLEFELHDCHGITHLPRSISLSSLRRCKIQYCDEMEWVVTPGLGTFSELEWLKIEGLAQLKTLCRGIPGEGTLSNLKVFHLSACDDLKALFSFEMVQNLHNLQEIVIENCRTMEEIISFGTEEIISFRTEEINSFRTEEEDQATEIIHAEVVLPRLQIMKLGSLPRLRRICHAVMICDFLSTIEVLKCPKLRTLSFFMDITEQLVVSLKQIKGGRRWWQELRNNHPHATQLLDSVFNEEPDEFSSEDEFDSSTVSAYSSIGRGD